MTIGKIIQFFRNKKRPNVLMILLDQLRTDKLYVHPIFEKMKKKGTFFSEMITYAPYTIASLSTIFSGLYGNKNGVNAYYKAKNFDHSNCYTLQEYLKGVGYYTRADTLNSLLVPNKGFDDLLTYDEDKVDMTSRHCEMIREVAKNYNKFFLFLHNEMIHVNWIKEVINQYNDTDKRFFGKIGENTKRYNTYVYSVGEYLLALFGVIEKEDLFTNTLIVVFTDHGCSLGEKMGERAYGVYTYDYTIKTTAYFIYSPYFPEGLEITNQVRTIDIMPTIMEVLKIKPKKDYQSMQGKSLLPMVTGREKNDRMAFSETGGLDGPHPSTHEPNVKCIRTGNWKLIYNTTTGKKELYDLTVDKEELVNLEGKFPEIEISLWEKLSKVLLG